MLSLLFALVAGQAATPIAAPVAPTAPVLAPVAEKKVCWKDQVTGSIMPPVRICMTRAERAAWVAKMQGNVNALADRPQRACSASALCEP